MISTYRYGTPRKGSELRLGVARQAPRGVRRQDYAKKNYFDLWLRVLGPSPELFRQYRAGRLTFRQFASRYRSEMSRLEARQILAVVAALAQSRPISLGCYCEEEDRCHRSVLKKLLADACADLPAAPCEERRRNASPVCYAEYEDL